jgi:hypothetical protein
VKPLFGTMVPREGGITGTGSQTESCKQSLHRPLPFSAAKDTDSHQLLGGVKEVTLVAEE